MIYCSVPHGQAAQQGWGHHLLPAGVTPLLLLGPALPLAGAESSPALLLSARANSHLLVLTAAPVFF